MRHVETPVDRLDKRPDELRTELAAAHRRLARLEDAQAQSRRLEASLRRSEESLRVLFELAPDPYYLSDLSGRFVDANQAAELLTGYRRDELIGRSFLQLGLLASNQVAKAAQLLAFSALSSPAGPEPLVLRRKGGTEIAVEVRTRPARVRGRCLVLGIVREVGGRGQAETERGCRAMRVGQAQKMEAVDRLASEVAHRFNNVLAVVQSYAQLIRREHGSNTVLMEDVGEIETATKRGAHLTRQLQRFSAGDSAQPVLLNLNEMIRAMGGMIETMLGEGVTVHFDLTRDLGMVEIDPNVAERLLATLVLNCRDALPPEGRVEIATRNSNPSDAQAGSVPGLPQGEYVQLVVTDNGRGMTDDVLERVFDPFFTTKTKGKGHGLGLTDVYGVAQRAGGHVDVRSTLNEGTEVAVSLPCCNGRRPPVADPETECLIERTGGTILVVEDEASVLRLTRRLLERRGYAVLTAPDAGTAASILHQRDGEIDLLLTDVVLPDINGKVLADQVVSRWPGTPVVYMSGHAEGLVADNEVLAAGITLVKKPFSSEELLLAVRRKIRKPSS